MFNPFKKREPEPTAPSAAPPAAPMPDNEPLVALIHQMKRDTLMGDMRPLHRAIIEAQLLVPLHEPPQPTPQGTRMLYMTFDNANFGSDSTLALFTDAERMREFLGDTSASGAQVCAGFWGGKTACNAAMSAALPLLAINPGGDAHYAMPPHVYRALAFGYVPSSVADEEMKSAQIAIARPLSGLPSAPELDAWRAVLQRHGAGKALFFNLLLDDVKELRYAIGVECDDAQFAPIQRDLVGAWFGIWPVNSPLWVQQLGDDEPSQAIREGGAELYGG